MPELIAHDVFLCSGQPYHVPVHITVLIILCLVLELHACGIGCEHERRGQKGEGRNHDGAEEAAEGVIAF